MVTLYHTGIVVGLIVVYLLVTIGFGFLLTLSKNDDGVWALVLGYAIGVLVFIFVAIELIDAKGYWNLPQLQIIEELETEVIE